MEEHSFEQNEKKSAALLFFQLFRSCNMHDDDFKKIKDFTHGNSSYVRTVVWLCQMADFLETGRVPNMGEIPVTESNQN